MPRRLLQQVVRRFGFALEPKTIITVRPHHYGSDIPLNNINANMSCQNTTKNIPVAIKAIPHPMTSSRDLFDDRSDVARFSLAIGCSVRGGRVTTDFSLVVTPYRGREE
jgi:hypothetical protein